MAFSSSNTEKRIATQRQVIKEPGSSAWRDERNRNYGEDKWGESVAKRGGVGETGGNNADAAPTGTSSRRHPKKGTLNSDPIHEKGRRWVATLKKGTIRSRKNYSVYKFGGGVEREHSTAQEGRRGWEGGG